ncbi:MAG: hypothetical protein JRF71_03470 [Deltaproteobacteria bacterium]|nr:hypothetical protein [Deltaproteobacteria bacterium]
MKKINTANNLIQKRLGISALVLALLITASVAFSHGGKHAAMEFTRLQALQKAAELLVWLKRVSWIRVGRPNWPERRFPHAEAVIRTKW